MIQTRTRLVECMSAACQNMPAKVQWDCSLSLWWKDLENIDSLLTLAWAYEGVWCKGFFQMQYYFYWSRLSLSMHACSISAVLKQHSYVLNQNSAKWNSKHLREYIPFCFPCARRPIFIYSLTPSWPIRAHVNWTLPFLS